MMSGSRGGGMGGEMGRGGGLQKKGFFNDGVGKSVIFQ